MEYKAFILAGGKGTRLRPYTYTIPKPLLPIGDRPILEYIIDRLKEFNFKHLFISTGYRSEFIKAFFGNGESRGVMIEYVQEDKPLGTCGPLSLIKSRIAPDEYFILMNGDIYTELDFFSLLDYAQKNEYELSVGYVQHTEVSKFGVLKIKNGQLTEIVEKPRQTNPVSAGVYVLKGSVLDLIPEQSFFTVPDLIEMMIAKGRAVGAYEIRDYWIGIEYVEDLQNVVQRLNKEALT